MCAVIENAPRLQHNIHWHASSRRRHSYQPACLNRSFKCGLKRSGWDEKSLFTGDQLLCWKDGDRFCRRSLEMVKALVILRRLLARSTLFIPRPRLGHTRYVTLLLCPDIPSQVCLLAHRAPIHAGGCINKEVSVPSLCVGSFTTLSWAVLSYVLQTPVPTSDPLLLPAPCLWLATNKFRMLSFLFIALFLFLWLSFKVTKTF